MSSVRISVERRRLIGVLIGVTLLLTFANLAHLYLTNRRDTDLRGLTWRIEMSGDSTIPTWFSSFILLLSAALFVVIYMVEPHDSRPARRYWRWLGIVFLVLSIDEVATLHETAGRAVDLRTTGYFFYTWVLFGAAAVLVFGGVFFRFFLGLDRTLQVRLAVAAIVYIGGALGVEMINAQQEFAAGTENWAYQLGTALEELLEMIGILILIDALLLHLQNLGAALHIDIGRESSDRASTVSEPHSGSSRSGAT